MILITAKEEKQISDYLFAIPFTKETAILLNALLPENIFDLGAGQILIQENFTKIGELGDYVVSRLRKGDKRLTYWIARKQDFERLRG